MSASPGGRSRRPATGGDVTTLVTAAQAGDEDALADLVATHLPLLYNVVGRALRGHADVDDVVQETMMRVVRGLPGLREPDRFRSWLIAIAHRQVQLYARRRRTVQQRRRDLTADPADPRADHAERTVSRLILAGQRRELAEATRWLDDDDRRLLELLWRETLGELSRAELAALLGVAPKLAELRLRRMKSQLAAVRAIVRALHDTPRCPDLAAVARSWDGDPTPLWRKRLTRHVRGCRRCGPHQQGLVSPERLLFGAGLAAAVSRVVALLSPKALVAAAAVTIATGGGLTYAVHGEPAPAPRPAALPSVAASSSAPGPAPRSPSASAARPAPAVAVPPREIVVAPGGSDSGPGTADRPYATLARAVATVRPGQTIALRGGTHRLTAPLTITTDGAATRRITLTSYPGERPVIDAGAVPAGHPAITQTAAYWTVRDLEIRNSRDHAYVCRSCRYAVFQRLDLHDNVRSGLTLRGAGTVGNRVLDSDFHHNYDPAEQGRAGIGLGIGSGSGEGNELRGNRAYANADNGFYLGDFTSPVTVEHNWAYGNGVNRWQVAQWRSNGDGFHLGGGNPVPAVGHVVRDNAAWDNLASGFSTSGNRGALDVSRNTSFRNGADGFYLLDSTGPATANVAAANDGTPGVLLDPALDLGNTWLSGEATTDVFRSTDPHEAEGPRQPDGTLPRVTFLSTFSGTGAAMGR